ncbi:MAG: ferritin family protein [Terracidiphilus sp.]
MPALMVQTGYETTIKNLLVAYAGETNTRAQYKAFAAQADTDGLSGIASLFRAAARAEQIHASNHARVLRQMGAEARAEVSAFKVRSTLENLKTALAGEKYEIESMYPGFIVEATAHINSTASRAFGWALEAEKSHQRLYSEAIPVVEAAQAASWINSPREFYVCPVCACTSEKKEADNCGICGYPAERAEAIS